MTSEEVPGRPEGYVDSLAEPPIPAGPAKREARPVNRRAVAIAAVVLLLLFASAAFAIDRIANAPVQVPDLVRMTEADAEDALAREGLAAGSAGRAATTGVEPGRVLSQSPGAGTRIARGAAVDVTISVAPSVHQVPDVMLIPQSAAVDVVTQSEYEPYLLRQFSDTAPIGVVVSQLPRAGQDAISGVTVVMFVSLGPGSGGAVVPDVRGSTQAQAIKKLSDARVFPLWLYDTVTSGPVGVVADQAPDPGARVPIGSAIALSLTKK